MLPDLLEPLPPGTPVDIVGGDGAYDTKSYHATIAATGAQPSILHREGATPWPEAIPGAAWRNAAIKAIITNSRANGRRPAAITAAR